MNEEETKENVTERSFQPDLDSLTHLSVNDHPVTDQVSKEGLPRQDKSVVIEGKEDSFPTSSIFMGYNKENVVLSNGSYANRTEILEAIANVFSSLSTSEKVVCKKTGKTVGFSEFQSLLSEVKNAGEILLRDNQKILNQMAKNVSIVGRGESKERQKGSMFLGNREGFTLENGEYLLLDEVKLALENYVIQAEKEKIPPMVFPILPGGRRKVNPSKVSPSSKKDSDLPPSSELDRSKEEEEKGNPDLVVPPISPSNSVFVDEPIFSSPDSEVISNPEVTPDLESTSEPEPTPEPEPYVEKEKKEKNRKWCYGLAILGIAALMGFGHGKETEITTTTDLTVAVHAFKNTWKEVDEDTQFQELLEQIHLGDQVRLPSGLEVHESSDYEYGGANRTGHVGNAYLPSNQEYTVSKFSVINTATGRIEETKFEDGLSLAEALTRTSQNTGIPLPNLEGKLHFENPTAGWVDVDLEVMKEMGYSVQQFEQHVIDLGTYQAVVTDSLQKTPVVSSDIGPLMVPRDAQVGDTFTRADGVSYQVDQMEETVRQQVHETEGKLEWKFAHIPSNLQKLAQKAYQVIGTAKDRLQNYMNSNENDMGGVSR